MAHFLSRRGALLAAFGSAAGMAAFGFGSFAADAGSFRRGVSIWPWFGLTREYPAPSRDYAWPPFQPDRTQPTAADLVRLRASHFDFIRIPLDAGPFIALRGQQRAELFAQLEQAMKLAFAADLAVILNPQPNEAALFWNARQFIDDGRDGSFGDYREFIVALVGLAKRAAPRLVAVELFNEPPTTCASPEWMARQATLLRDARGVAPDVKLILTGGCGGMVAGLEALDPPEAKDPHVLYNFHFYEPYVFSHQGAVWMTEEPMYRYLRDVPWPASSGDERATRDAAVARIGSDARLKPAERDGIVAATEHALAQYFAGDPGPAYIRSFFAKIVGWREKHGVEARRVLLGEFGATKFSAAPDRARYLRDVRMAAEENGFPWAFWNLFDVMGLTVDDHGRALDPELLAALGIGPER